MKAIFGALLISLLAIGQAHAGPTSLSGAGVTGTYSAGGFGYELSALDPFNNNEFLTDNNYFFIDLFENGQVDVWHFDNLGPFAAGSQVLTFSFTGLTEAITGFEIVNASQVSGLVPSALNVVDADTITLDLSNISWSGFSFTAQLVFGELGGDVPAPGSLALIGLGLAALAARRASRS